METLEHGMYCEVTREQAVELLTIDGFVVPEWYAGDFFLGKHDNVYARLDKIGIVLSGIVHGDMTRHLQFPDFRQRLINTVNNK